MSHAMRVVKAVSVFSSVGARPAQEDHVHLRQEKGIFIVADGFGGPQPGASAAKTACEAVESFLFKEAGDLDATLPFEIRPYFSLAGNVLFNSLIHANRKVLKLNHGKGVHEKGGASVIAGFIDGDLLALANVGGCTAWLARGGRATELVAPRTFGTLRDPFARERGDELSAPLMAVGMHASLEPEIFEFRIEAGDWLFLQTDGLGSASREDVLALQQSPREPETAAREALEKLNSGQYQDNASALLVIFG